jgi:hypothetical protein
MNTASAAAAEALMLRPLRSDSITDAPEEADLLVQYSWYIQQKTGFYRDSEEKKSSGRNSEFGNSRSRWIEPFYMGNRLEIAQVYK